MAKLIYFNGKDLIDGVASKTLATQYKYIIVVSNGANWDVIGGN